MVTQKIVTRLSNDVLPPVRMVSGDVGREIQLEIYANDESLAPIDLETYSARITIIKPDKTFVIQDFDNDKVELPEQAGAVTGHGYYQIKIYTAGNHQIYTGQGPFIVDDDVLSDEMIESVAEVNGYEFPDDFLTDADLREYVTKYELEDALAGIIDDDTTDYNSTWSSAKISESLSSVAKTATGNPIEFTDGADAPLVKCVTAITGYQSGTGTPSPDNIRPIVAYTEGEIEVRDGDGNTTTYTTTFPSAIYRGSEDVVNGSVTGEWRAVDLGVLTWVQDTSRQIPTFSASLATPKINASGWYSDIVCEQYFGSDAAFSDGSCSIFYNKRIYICDSRYTDAMAFMTAVTGVKLAYELATPTTSSVTPTNLPIKSLSGYNHIVSSTGEMEVEYIKQTYDAIMEATKLDNMKVYSTAEQVVGKWVDGSDLKEKTYIYTGTGVANPFTTTIDFTGKSIIEVIQHYVKFTYGGGTVGYCAGSALVNNNSNLMNVAYDDNRPPTVKVTCYIGSGTETYEVAFTIRYI